MPERQELVRLLVSARSSTQPAQILIPWARKVMIMATTIAAAVAIDAIAAPLAPNAQHKTKFTGIPMAAPPKKIRLIDRSIPSTTIVFVPSAAINPSRSGIGESNRRI